MAQSDPYPLGFKVDNAGRIVDLMDRIGERVVPAANPCPSREEWDEIRMLSSAEPHWQSAYGYLEARLQSLGSG